MLHPIPEADWPAELADLRGGFAGRLNVYRTMAHHPALLRAWADFRNHVVIGNTLGPQFSEVVILRTGVRLGSDYEWGHHVLRGRKVGLTDARIGSIRGAPGGMAAEDRILCAAVDRLFDHDALDGTTLAALAGLVGPQGVLDVMATVAHYRLLGAILLSFGVPLDADAAAELAAAPLAGQGDG